MAYHNNISGMTWGQLEENLEDKADPLGLTILGHLLDDVAEETGSWPDWSDPVPPDILDVFYLSGRCDITGDDARPGDPGYTWLS